MHELEAAVEGLEDGAIEGLDLAAESSELVHPSSFSGFSLPSVLSVRLNPVAHT
jgi:hypothetical protein